MITSASQNFMEGVGMCLMSLKKAEENKLQEILMWKGEEEKVVSQGSP